MVTLQSAENALKNVYLGVVANQLNTAANPLLSMIKRSTNNIYGKEIRKAAPVGINGGISAGDEDGKLPDAHSTQYVQFVAELKNLYGKLEISDKALRATSNNITSFVNLLNDEMERLIEASNFNLGRMLYGKGNGELAAVETYNETDGYIQLTTVANVIEGMAVKVSSVSDGTISDSAPNFIIQYVDRKTRRIYTDIKKYQNNSIGAGSKVYVQNSMNKEITGIDGIFSNSTLYGLTKTDYKWLNPYLSTTTSYISDNLIQSVIDELEEVANSKVNLISTTKSVKRLYQEYLAAYRRNIDITELAGGYKTMTYNGIPVIGEKFVPNNTMYLLNTDDFTMYEMCDWKWLEDESGRILKQNPGYPTYSATLVKYAELLCERPNGQAKISNIATTLTPPESAG
ncbi:MAG TPA: phage major capsid protein [Candidatus Caccovivens faecavium]|nr:phage major capsid protein [Candidatus Caccovivens faecavium]